MKKSVADMIAATEAETPSNSQLEEVTALADAILEHLGGPTEGPNRDAYGNLADWAKKYDIEPDDVLPGVSIATLTAALLLKLKRLRILQEQLLPDAMAAIGGGFTEFKLKSGYNISIKDDLVANIKHDAAFEWLMTEGFGDVIKDDVTVRFGRDESPEELLQYCREQHLNAEEKVSVHEYNTQFMGPGTKEEVSAIARSLHKKGYCYKCNDVPLNQHCNREEYYNRKYGLTKPGRKSSRDGRTCILDELDRPGICYKPPPNSNDDPTWEFTMGGKSLCIDMDTLMNQRAFMKEFLRVFHRLILLVKEDVWVESANNLLAEVEYVPAPIDAGPEGQLMLHLEAYCTGRIQARDKTELLLGKPFTGLLKDHHINKMCWFRSKDFVKYLDQQHFRSFSDKEIWVVLRRQGAQHTTITIKGICVAVWGVNAFDFQMEGFDPIQMPKGVKYETAY